MTAVNTLMLISIVLTALSGISMSGHAVPFLYGMINVMTARTLHLAMSWWSFILMGIHIGLHIKAMTAKLPDKGKTAFNMILTGVSGAGLWLFLKNGIVNYITFRTHFAFLDYQTAKWHIILQNLAMLMFFVLVGYVLSEVTQKNKDMKYSPMPLVWLGCAVIIGSVMFFALKESGGGRFGQSLTAIAKLAPDSTIGEGLSVHYSSGNTLDEDISEWLKENGIDEK